MFEGAEPERKQSPYHVIIAPAGSSAPSRIIPGAERSGGNGPVLNANTKAQANDGGTFSKSHTKTKVKAGEEVSSRTKTMAHEPGSKPVMSTTGAMAR